MPVRNFALIGWATAVTNIGRILPDLPDRNVAVFTIMSALYIIVHTAAATIETPEVKSMSGPPSSSPVISS